MGAGVAGHEIDQRALDRFGEGLGQAGRQGDAERVPNPGGVLGGGEALLPRHRTPDGSGGGHQLVEPLGRRAVAAGVGLLEGQRAEGPQDVGQLVRVPGPAAVAEPLQVQLQVGQDTGVDQLPQLLGAQQVPQQVPVECQRRGPALGQRGVPLVHVDGDPAEQQRLGEGRGLPGLDGDDPHVPGSQPAEHLTQGGHVERVVQALTGGLQQEREVRVPGRHLEEVGRPLPLLPQRGAAVRPTPGQEQGPGRGLPEAAGEQRGVRQLGHDQLVHVLGVDEQLVERQVVDRLRQAEGDAVVAPHQLDLEPPLLGQAVLQGHGPRGVDPGAEGAEDADPPVADLVPEALDDDRPVVGQRPRRLDLLVEVAEQVVRRHRVQPVALDQPGDGVAVLADLAGERADRPPQLQRASRAVAVPERHLPGLAGGGGHDDALGGDVLDAPGRRPEQEGLAGAALVDHLLVELTDPRAVGQEHAVQAPVGDGPAAGHRQALGAGPAADDAVDPVPHDSGAQLAELLGRIAAGEEVEDVVEDLVGQVGVGRRPPDDRRQVVQRPLVEGDHGHDLLGQHVEWVAQVPGRLDGALVHAVDDHRRLQQVGPVLREDAAPAGHAHLVAGPADALQAAGDRARRLDLDRPGRRRPCRCPAPGCWWPRGHGGRPASARPRSPAGARG